MLEAFIRYDNVPYRWVSVGYVQFLSKFLKPHRIGYSNRTVPNQNFRLGLGFVFWF